jgi:hypothetical protein
MRGLVSQPLGEPAVAPDAVNQPMIRHWAAAMEDHNPVYTDVGYAAASRFGGIVARATDEVEDAHRFTCGARLREP